MLNMPAVLKSQKNVFIDRNNGLPLVKVLGKNDSIKCFFFNQTNTPAAVYFS